LRLVIWWKYFVIFPPSCTRLTSAHRMLNFHHV
jgi:hypothetical protein